MAFDIGMTFVTAVLGQEFIDDKTHKFTGRVAKRIKTVAKSKAHVLTGVMREGIDVFEISQATFDIATQTTGEGYGAIEELRGGDHAFMRPSLFQVQGEISQGTIKSIS